jgi:hypothetical protein
MRKEEISIHSKDFRTKNQERKKRVFSFDQSDQLKNL